MTMQNLVFRDLSPTVFAKTTGHAFLRAITWPTSPFQDAGRLCWLSGKITITLLSVWPISPPDRRESPFRPTAEAGMVMPPRPQLFPPHVSHVLDIWRFLCPRVLPQARGQPLLSDTWCHSSAWLVSQVWQCKICQMRRGNGNGSPWLGLNKVHCGEFYKDVTIGDFLRHIFINPMKSKSTLCLSMCQVMNNATSVFKWRNDSSLKVHRDGSPSLKPTFRQFRCVEYW